MNPRVLSIARHFPHNEQADCGTLPRSAHFAAAGVFGGRKATAYPACAPDVSIVGATYVETR